MLHVEFLNRPDLHDKAPVKDISFRLAISAQICYSVILCLKVRLSFCLCYMKMFCAKTCNTWPIGCLLLVIVSEAPPPLMQVSSPNGSGSQGPWHKVLSSQPFLWQGCWFCITMCYVAVQFTPICPLGTAVKTSFVQ